MELGGNIKTWSQWKVRNMEPTEQPIKEKVLKIRSKEKIKKNGAREKIITGGRETKKTWRQGNYKNMALE